MDIIKDNKKSLLETYTKNFLEVLISEVNDPMMFKNFFSNFEIVNYENANGLMHVTISTTISSSSIIAISNMFSSSIAKALEETFDQKCSFSFIEREKPEIKRKKETKNQIINNLNKDIRSDLTFDNYVECDFNKEAIKVANYLIEGGKEYVPIFIFGKSGLGKTHLVQAISNKLIENNYSVKYVNANAMSRDISYLLQENNQKKLKTIVDEFNNTDIVIFDDFQIYGIGNKKATINFIFSILDYRINEKKITIVCSDRPIYSLKNMFNARLIGRLSVGYQLEIKEPQQTDLLKILNFMIKNENLSPDLWDKDAKQYIIRNFSNSIRTLIGAITRLKFYKKEIDKTNSEYTLTIVSSILSDIQQYKEKLTPDTIIEYVAKYYKVSKKEILGKGRQKDVVLARHIAIYLIRSQINISLEQIGKIFGNRDHSTIINAIKKIDKEAETPETSLKRTLNQISDDLYRNK